MTKNELITIKKFLSQVITTYAELKMYGKDYDSATISNLAKSLGNSIEEFKKKVKL